MSANAHEVKLYPTNDLTGSKVLVVQGPAAIPAYKNGKRILPRQINSMILGPSTSLIVKGYNNNPTNSIRFDNPYSDFSWDFEVQYATMTGLDNPQAIRILDNPDAAPYCDLNDCTLDGFGNNNNTFLSWFLVLIIMILIIYYFYSNRRLSQKFI